MSGIGIFEGFNTNPSAWLGSLAFAVLFLVLAIVPFYYSYRLFTKKAYVHGFVCMLMGILPLFMVVAIVFGSQFFEPGSVCPNCEIEVSTPHCPDCGTQIDIE